MNENNCNCNNHCVKCRKDKKCGSPCGCAEPVFSVEAMPDNPALLRFNVNGKSVWFDFEPVVKTAETCTTFNLNLNGRTLDYNGECGQQTFSARDLGSILHLADIGDVAGDTVDDYGILNYRKKANCGEGCEGIDNGWVSTNPTSVAGDQLEYILGSDAKGEMKSLWAPQDSSTFSYLAWAAQGKAKWVKPRQITALSSNYAPLYIDKTTGEIVVYIGGA